MNCCNVSFTIRPQRTTMSAPQVSAGGGSGFPLRLRVDGEEWTEKNRIAVNGEQVLDKPAGKWLFGVNINSEI